jgi:LysR family transcriptional regulator (chromosome initiation inhibitor)
LFFRIISYAYYVEFDQAQLAALGAAVSEGTLEAAARRLHVTPSAVSQRIKALESQVGRVLLVRSKPVRATASGQVLVRLALQMQAVAQEATRELTDEDGGQGLRIPLAVNADSLATWFLPALVDAGPGLFFDLRCSDEEGTAELLREGAVMAAVTAAAQPVPGCTVHRLGRMRYRPRARAAFAAEWFPDGVTPAALAHAPVVCFDQRDQLQDTYLRRHSRNPLNPPRHHVPASTEFATAIRLGLGWGMVPDLQTGEELVELDPNSKVDVLLHWQQWRLPSPTLERVSTAVTRAAANALR